MDEVQIFRTNPSLWWLPQAQPKLPVQLIVADKGPFLAHKFPQQIRKKFGIPFTIVEGGHMFPLEQPEQVATLVKQLIQQPFA
jgi:pimeloyl-ACP methyl ester carboxylesterase